MKKLHTVKEVIEILQEFDEDTKVAIFDPDNGFYTMLVEPELGEIDIDWDDRLFKKGEAVVKLIMASQVE